MNSSIITLTTLVHFVQCSLPERVVAQYQERHLRIRSRSQPSSRPWCRRLSAAPGPHKASVASSGAEPLDLKEKDRRENLGSEAIII
ncbi:hypothetical protein EVAR_86960_1 [Eumeta japonica]|uniref:Uncharacterized protein n=1 Tax=Eumeta variegata TaxID=151549 RepID=A0A4C1W9A9_EUMVA|nr:hypothetical protein EVAR_86960_1 [Eumeta japonica]